MVDIQIITNSPNQGLTKSYWQWKDTRATLPNPDGTGTIPNPNVGLYVPTTLSRIMLEYMYTKYNITDPLKTDVQWTIEPYLEVNGYQVVVLEGNVTYEEYSYPVEEATQEIIIDCYTLTASLGETFHQLENLWSGCLATWLNYDNHRINGLHSVHPKNKNMDYQALAKDRSQNTDSTFIKELILEVKYYVQRTTQLPSVTFTYDNPEIAGALATN